ncbi:GxxExxY protein [Aliifodinibius sp. S!AR15-10]|uniref:GxxExxY protein n=1 Tax=Aliifodinibius sp. S!AR15-10 TaxID=2950437 RepID=UPI002860DC3B|nr:GxxExxY protein [Aliifodinibius sp. S!AR15-10]MDR8389764.1 GxxExxY protein [Aliifodinibius sp. S!AR15-10]
MRENKISNKVIGAAIEVHRQLGPGLLESAYQRCMFYKLLKAGVPVKKEVPMPIIYKEIHLDHGYRMDLLVDAKVVVEIKTVESITDVHSAQLLKCLRLGNFKLGLIINFHVKLLKNGIKSLIN